MNWQQQTADSHYKTAVAVRDTLRLGHISEAEAGIEELIDALARSERRALKSQLVRLMAHVLKWRSQPDGRCRSWSASIRTAREEIADIQRETPSLTDDVVRALWSNCFETARAQAAAEMDRDVAIDELTWDAVFLADYRLSG